MPRVIHQADRRERPAGLAEQANGLPLSLWMARGMPKAAKSCSKTARTGSPAVLGGSAVTTGCDGFLRLVDVRTGKESGAVQLGTYVAASCAVLKGRGYVGTFGNQVLGIDLEEGRILWRYEHGKHQFPFYASAAVDGNVVVVGGRDKMVHALDPKTGEALWTFAAGARVDSSPVLVGDRVFFGSEKGVVHALDVVTGEETWRFETGSAVVASPAVADGRLVIGADNGVLYCFGEGG